MISIKRNAIENSLYELESQLREYRNCIDTAKRAVANLSDQKGLEEELAALRVQIKRMEDQAEVFRKMILALGRSLQLYQRNEQLLVNKADAVQMARKKLHSGMLNIDSGFINKLGLRVGNEWQ